MRTEELVREMLANRNSNIDLAEFDKLDEERRTILGEVELLKQKEILNLLKSQD